MGAIQRRAMEILELPPNQREARLKFFESNIMPPLSRACPVRTPTRSPTIWISGLSTRHAPESKTDSQNHFGRPRGPAYQPRAKSIPRAGIRPGDGEPFVLGLPAPFGPRKSGGERKQACPVRARCCSGPRGTVSARTMDKLSSQSVFGSLLACGRNQRPTHVPLRTGLFGLIQLNVVGRTVGLKLTSPQIIR